MKTKHRLWIPATMLAISSFFLVTNCTKDEVVIREKSIPVLITQEIMEINQTTVSSGGNITSDGGATVTARGVCWSTNQSPTIADNKTTDGTGIGWFTSSITDLSANTTYYVRAYATNSVGTGYGSVMSYTTHEENSTNYNNIEFNPNITYDTIIDIDGNTYKTVTIGTQTWTAENLKVTKYNDGTTIPNITDSSVWNELTTGAFCDYENLSTISLRYGKLYNWYAVNTGKLCPTGWHVPTDAEWIELTDNLGGTTEAGGKLKETGRTHWTDPNMGATNETGFTSLPGGCRMYDGTFSFLNELGVFWTATEYDATLAWYLNVYFCYSNVDRLNYIKNMGISVRCIRN